MATRYRDKKYREARVRRMIMESPYSANPYYITSQGGYGSPRIYSIIINDENGKIERHLPSYGSLNISEFGNYVDGMIEAFEMISPSEVVDCDICGQSLKNQDSHNAEPVKEGGRCCEMCNYAVVLPLRMEQAIGMISESNGEVQ